MLTSAHFHARKEAPDAKTVLLQGMKIPRASEAHEDIALLGGSCTIRKGLAILAQDSQCSELPRSVDVRLAKIANDVQRDNGRDAPRRQVVGNSFRRVPRIIENINPIAVFAYIARKIAAVLLLLLSFVRG